jgi:uncharacterized protein (DUF433 family)
MDAVKTRFLVDAQGQKSAVVLSISDWEQLGALVTTSPDVLGGIPVFSGTRVPIKTLFDYLHDGDSLDQFLDEFPSVRREQAVTLLDFVFSAFWG